MPQPTARIIGQVVDFGSSTGVADGVRDVIVDWHLTEFIPPEPGVGQVALLVQTRQSEAQFVNDIRTALADYLNGVLGTAFTITDVFGCNL